MHPSFDLSNRVNVKYGTNLFSTPDKELVDRVDVGRKVRRIVLDKE